MSEPSRSLARRYASALEAYLADSHEAGLQQAYELGRRAIAGGLGVLEVARIHERALAACFGAQVTQKSQGEVWGAAEMFLLEALSPFEVIQRGFRETNLKLQQVIAAVEKRNLQLAEINRKLKSEISERKRSAKALKASEERFRLLVAHVNDYAIFLLRPDGRIASWNAGAERINGYREEEVLGRHFSCFYLPRDAKRGKPARLLKTALRLGRAAEEGWRLRKDGSRFWASVVITPVHDDADRLRGFAKVTRDMTELKRAEDALRRSQEHYQGLFKEAQVMQKKLRNLSNQILAVQEQERLRLSRELHDEVGQALTAISVNLAMLRKSGGLDGSPAGRRLGDAQTLLQETMETVHRFSLELRPAMLDELGLLPALRSCLLGFAERTGLRVRFRGSPMAEQLNDVQKIAVYRIAQESLTNVAKHARASRVDVAIRKLKDGVCVEVADDGKSFREDATKSAKHQQRLGLLGMQERARLVNGRFRVIPRPGKGTTVRVIIPLKAAGSAAHYNGRGGARGQERKRSVRATLERRTLRRKTK